MARVTSDVCYVNVNKTASLNLKAIVNFGEKKIQWHLIEQYHLTWKQQFTRSLMAFMIYQPRNVLLYIYEMFHWQESHEKHVMLIELYHITWKQQFTN